MKEKVILCKFGGNTMAVKKRVYSEMNEVHLSIGDLFVCEQIHHQRVFVLLMDSLYLIYHSRRKVWGW